MAKWVALLKGVNVGGNRVLPMSDLRSLLSDIGLTEPRTLLASGNAVFGAGKLAGPEIEALLERELADRLGLHTDVIARSGGEIARIVGNNPFPEVSCNRPDQLVVAFGREPVAPDLPAQLAAIYDGPERVAAAGCEMYIDFPTGQGRSKLWPAIARLPLSIGTGTARNWNTLVKLDNALNGG